MKHEESLDFSEDIKTSLLLYVMNSVVLETELEADQNQHTEDVARTGIIYTGVPLIIHTTMTRHLLYSGLGHFWKSRRRAITLSG